MSDHPSTCQAIAAIIARYAVADGDFDTPVGALRIGRRSSPTKPNFTAQWPCFALLAQGAKQMTLGDEVYEYSTGDYLVLSVDLPITSCVVTASPETPQLGVGMAIDPAKIGTLLGRVRIPRPLGDSDGLRGAGVSKASPALLDAVFRLLSLLDAPQHAAALAPLIEEEILYHLLTGPDGGRLIQIATEDSQGNRVAQAIKLLRNGYADSLRIEDLARAVGMSVSSLHHHFKAVTSMTPIQYQKQLRLQEARRLLVVDRVAVGAAGYRVGYQSPSQFSREYSRQYGRSPVTELEESTHA